MRSGGQPRLSGREKVASVIVVNISKPEATRTSAPSCKPRTQCLRDTLIAFLSFALLLSITLSKANAQTSTSTQSSSFIAGTIVGEPGNHPLKKVIVQVVSEDQKQGGNYSTITDPDGHFRIEHIVPGRYRVFFEKTGYVEVNGRGQKADVNMVTVPAGQSVDDMIFHMLPAAVVTGRVTDEDGDPMSGVRVVALRKIPGKGKRESVNAVATDDQGEYRLPGLFPGQYWIAAIPQPDFRDYAPPHDKSSSPDTQPETRYLTTYYPGTYDGGQASPIAVKAGDETPVNLTLVPARTYRIRGTVTGIKPGEKTAVEVVSQLGDSIQGSEVGSDGAFEVHGIATGSYELKASTTGESTVLTARQQVNVVAGDVDGVRLVPMPSFAVTGHLRNDGASTIDFSQYAVNLRQADVPEDGGIFMSPDSFGENAQVDRQGNFSWKNVNPGTYIVRLYGGNGQDNAFLKSARMGDTTIDAGFSVSGPATLDLVVSGKAGTVEGVVSNRDQSGNQGADQAEGQHGGGQESAEKPASNVAVVAVPEEKYRKIPERFGVGATDQYGHFTIRGLAPGNYTLFAWQDVDEEVYRDPEFLKSQGAGKPVKIEEGSRQAVNLNLSPVGEDWR
jgi:protocatechuate 3,4-dioxygenase beta subunit